MRRSLLVFWLLSGPAAALETVATPRAETGAWATPITRTFIQVGTNRLSSLGQHSLKALSRLIVTEPRRIDPAAFGRLAEALAKRGLTPDSFSALVDPEKESALKQAAAAAESAAEAESASALSRMPEKLTDDAAARLQSELAPLAADEIYLSPDRRERASAALRSINDFKKRRNDELAAWWRDTPLKLHEGAFDGPAHIVKTEGGWRIGEHAPTQQAYPSYAAAFAARMAEIEAMTDGPWKKRAFGELARNVSSFSPSLLEQASQARERIGTSSSHASFKKSDFRHTIAMAEHYNALARHAQFSIQNSWRLFSTLFKGDKDYGYPSYQDLASDLKSATTQAEKNNSRIIATLCYVLLPAFLTAAVAQVPASIFFGLLAIVIGFLAFAMATLSRELEIPSLHPGFEEFNAALDAARKAREASPQ